MSLQLIAVNCIMGMQTQAVAEPVISASMVQDALYILKRDKVFFEGASHALFGMVSLQASKISLRLNEDKHIERVLVKPMSAHSLARLIATNSLVRDRFRNHVDICLECKDEKPAELVHTRLNHTRLVMSDGALTGGSPDGLFGEFEEDFVQPNNSL